MARQCFRCAGNTVQQNTFENLTINGVNQTLNIYASVDNSLKNVCLVVGASGQTDNTPLKITNSFWFFMDGGCLQGGNATLPVALFTGETPLASEAPLVGLAYFTNIQGSGGGMQYIQRVNTVGSGPGNFVFRNVSALENINTSFITFTNATGNPGNVAMPMVSNLTFDNVSTSDGTVFTPAVLEMNSSGSTLSGVWMMNSLSGNGGEGAGDSGGCGDAGGLFCEWSEPLFVRLGWWMEAAIRLADARRRMRVGSTTSWTRPTRID